MSYNKVITMGNLVRDPELRSTAGGTAVCNFTVATNHKYGDREEKCFFPYAAFGKAAESIAKYFSKGDPILAEGRQKLEEWVDNKSGENKSRTVVTLESWSFVRGGESPRQEPEAQQKEVFDNTDESSDLPF